MNVDIKHDLLKNFLSDQKLGQKKLNTTIDQSMVASAEQKSLGMDPKDDGSKNNDHKMKKKKAALEAKKQQVLEDERLKKLSDKIERDPMKLLNLF